MDLNFNQIMEKECVFYLKYKIRIKVIEKSTVRSSGELELATGLSCLWKTSEFESFGSNVLP